jgi:hypothetical protein
MKPFDCQNRRNFLKASTAAAGALLAQGNLGRVFAAPSAGWKNGMQINPAIDNLRVAYVCDPITGAGHMLKSNAYSSWSSAQANSINQAVVTDNMGKLAMALAKKATPGEAWAAIFQKPSSKQWNQVKAAIKVNAYATLNPSAGVVNTLVQALYGLGVPYANITIFDNGATATPAIYNGNIQGGVTITHDPQAGASTAITVADANGSGPMRYLSFLDAIDILISCAVCKSHDQDIFGKTSMTLKNHVGTIWSDNVAHCPNKWETQLIAMNKSTPIIGNPDPVAGVPPRQQLCVIDGIFAAKNTSYLGTVDCPPPGVIVMGTLAGAVDYLTVYNVRIPMVQPVLTAYNLQQTNKFLTEFGYDGATATALLTMNPALDANGRGWVDALTYQTLAQNPAAHNVSQKTTVTLSASGKGMSPETSRLFFDSGCRVETAFIHDGLGRLIRQLSPRVTAGGAAIDWDGLTHTGSRAVRGTYFLNVNASGLTRSCRIFIR